VAEMNHYRYYDKPNLRTKVSKWGWGIMVTLSAVLIINGLHLYMIIVETAQQQTIAILLTGFGALSLVAALDGYRNRSKPAQAGMWVVLFVMAVISLHMFLNEQTEIGTWYTSLAIVMLTGIAFPFRLSTIGMPSARAWQLHPVSRIIYPHKSAHVHILFSISGILFNRPVEKLLNTFRSINTFKLLHVKVISFHIQCRNA